MGIYVYTMRKATRRLVLPNGEKVDARYYSYAYKPYYCFIPPKEAKRFEASMNSRAEKAFEDYDNGYVIVGDAGESLEGCYVYRAVRHCTWSDCNEFPGEAVGIIKMKGRLPHVVTKGDWYGFDTPDDREYRTVIKDGKFATEGRFISDKYPIIPGETVDNQGNRIHA